MFETERLLLRKMSRFDADAIFAMRSSPNIMRFIREPQIRRETDNWIKLVSSRWQNEKIGFCAVLEKKSNEFAGWCGLWRLTETGEIEIGYAIAKKFWRKGYATESAARILQYGFDELKFNKIAAVTHPENSGARRVMEKIGMSFDCIGKFYERDLAHYSITKKEFFNARFRSTGN